MVRSGHEAPKVDVKHEIDESMKSVPSPPRLELSNEISNVLNDADNIINNDFVKVEELDYRDIQEIKYEYSFDNIKNEFDGEKVRKILEIFYNEADNGKSRIDCEMLGLTGDNTDFINFVSSMHRE